MKFYNTSLLKVGKMHERHFSIGIWDRYSCCARFGLGLWKIQPWFVYNASVDDRAHTANSVITEDYGNDRSRGSEGLASEKKKILHNIMWDVTEHLFSTNTQEQTVQPHYNSNQHLIDQWYWSWVFDYITGMSIALFAFSILIPLKPFQVLILW